MKENKHIIYFDGVCGLCNSFVSLLLKIDSDLKFATLQGKSGQELLNKINFNNSEFDTVIFQKNDQIYTKSTAVFEIFKTIGGIWKIFLIFSLLPISLTDTIYRYIALKRFKIFGKLDQCDISIFNKPGQFID
jgi:predicted DCC family thiol-disulfide oxidoreductase YuxK|tara:strand:+ start:7841 stop:8239 length:399 start_codon:yes stop_codon:yes gene_type:complete